MSGNEAGRTCVVGAGPAGLAMMRALGRHGLEFDCFERHEDVGGIWDQANPGSPVYDSAHFISSRSLSGFHGYPMPEHLPDYPDHRQVLTYLRDFADAYGLRERVTTSTAVERAEPEPGGGWRATLAGGEVRGYDQLVCANGTTWDPSSPELEGDFAGQILHSGAYRSTATFAGKRALVVGAGNSGVDIACDAAQSAEAAWISMRRGYHVVPKHIFGTPAGVFAESGPELPMWAAQRILPALIRLQTGNQQRLGLPKPDHRLFETHPILNSQILHHLSHGDIGVKPDVRRLDGEHVEFADGTRERVDVVVLATGYRYSIPYLDQELIDWKGGRPQLYLHLFSPRREDLYGIGFTEGDGGAYALFDEMADLIANAIATSSADAGGRRERLERTRRGPPPDVSGGVRHVPSDRHASYLHLPAYRKAAAALRSDMGWLEPSWTSP
ncbi:MAG: NAD(P)-binding domain-containing protein [Thermoleophilaceae bacterium]|nr:NAD(P)-binding domain-containing protein [Thermoleophilaceae bacterium]